MDLLDTHLLNLVLWDKDNKRIHITCSSIVSQLHLRCLKMSNSAPSRLPPQEGWLGWPTLGPTLGKRCIVEHIVHVIVHSVYYPPNINRVHFAHVPCVDCILSCAMCVVVFCALFVFTEQVLKEVVRFEDSQFFSFPPLVRPLCGTIIMEQKMHL